MRYRVRAGFRHGARREFGPGDVLELTEQEAAGFLDKLEPVDDDDAPAAPEIVAPDKEPAKRSKRKEPAP